MIDLLQKIDYGSNVECLMESEEWYYVLNGEQVLIAMRVES